MEIKRTGLIGFALTMLVSGMLLCMSESALAADSEIRVEEFGVAQFVEAQTVVSSDDAVISQDVEDGAIFDAAGDIIDTGEFGDTGNNLVWTITAINNDASNSVDHRLTISGIGGMGSFYNKYIVERYLDKVRSTYPEEILELNSSWESKEFQFVPWGKWHVTMFDEIVIEEGVTDIGSFAFAGLAELRSVVIPESVKKIDEYAFAGCSNLTQITLPAGLETLDASAFLDCGGLRSVKWMGEDTQITIDAYDSLCSFLDPILLHPD